VNPEHKVIIDGLAAAVAEKRQLVEGLGMMNVNGVDEAARMRQSMRFTQARSDLWNAESALRAAIARYEDTP
jgi:hypothetical protein